MTVHKDLVERLRQAALIPRPTVKEKQLILFAADILEKLTDENNALIVSGFKDCPITQMRIYRVREQHPVVMAIEAYGATQALEELEDDGEVYESIEDIWPDYPSKDDFFWNEEEY